MDFRLLQTPEPHPWWAYFYAMFTLAAWAFAMGAFFAVMHQALGWVRLHAHLPPRHA